MNIIKLFFAFVILFIGFLLLPFVVMGGFLGGVFGSLLVLLLGGSTVYIGYLLFKDDFAPLSPSEERTVKQVALLAALIGVGGQLGMRFAFGMTGTALYAELLLGASDANALKLILLLLTTLASATAVLPIYLWATAEMDFSYHDYVIVTRTNGLETNREYGSSSIERPILTVVALMTAVLGILSTHVLLLFLILGVDLSLFMPTYRSSRCMLGLSVITGLLASLATFGNVGYEMDAIVKALDVFPLVLFGVAMLGLWLYREGHIYTLGLVGILFGSLIPSWILSLLPFLFLPDFSLSPLQAVGQYAVLAYAVLAAVLSVLALRSVLATLRTVGKPIRPLFVRWLALVLAVVLLSLVLLFLLFGLFTGSFLSGFSLPSFLLKDPEISYTLEADATFEVGGVRYGISDRGVIALSVLDPDAETVTLTGYSDQYDTATERAAELLEGDPSRYQNRVYAIARGFLSDNSAIKTLVLPKELTLAYIEEDAVTDCENLESVLLYHAVDPSVGEGLACCSSSFPRGMRLEVGSLYRLEAYISAFAKVGGRLVYREDVYFRVLVDIDWFRYGDLNGKTVFDSASGSISLHGNILGHKRISHSFRFTGLEGSGEVKVFSAGDPVRCREGGSSMTVDYSVAGRVKLKAWILENFSSFGGAGSVTAAEDSFYIMTERSHRGDEDTVCDVNLYTDLVYRAPEGK